MVVVLEGWGLTWADDQIWSGMWSWYGISLKSAGWRFASGGKGRRCTVRMQQGAGYEPTATGGLYVAADQDGINCHSPFDHSTAGSLSKGFTSWGGGGLWATITATRPYDDIHHGMVNVTHQSHARQTRNEQRDDYNKNNDILVEWGVCNYRSR